ncbi:phage baseplate plug family protein [Pectobacterium polaris]|uniref:phage baseplate plug family protein n=1 Tax=Pectobacterium polaris TaxID=2042057 RepID=UPI0032E376BE
MANKLPLEELPNQSFTIRLDNSRYAITIKTLTTELMAISIYRDDVLLIQNQRAMPDTMLLPSHMANRFGNFMFTTPNDEYPYYTAFGAGHELHYIPASEL